MSFVLEDFWKGLAFNPDPFQIEAAERVAAGDSVVVTAPTGAGKTLVAEASIRVAFARGDRAFYTAPIKALSNQKFAEFAGLFGVENVGLLTGDNVISGSAPLVVMTTEVLRNMIYSDSSRLDEVSVVVLDEVHYLQDRSRGAVWEEVLIHCPAHVQMVCLSATISNNEEFAAWVGERRGGTGLVSTSQRPVPLEPMYLTRDKLGADRPHLAPMFVGRDGRRRSNPKLDQMLGVERRGRRRYVTPSRLDTVEELAVEDMLPAIYFIFSRAGCDAAAQRLSESGLVLTTSEDRESIREIAESRTTHVSKTDLTVLEYERWIASLESGFAAHHAGMIPAFKETVEELFELGMLKVVFATETLAVGINMPARSVVLESLSKFNGESHEPLRPGDFTQLTGRAGRRGIDDEGFGVVLHSPFSKFKEVTEIAGTGSHTLRSSFKPTYNMTANLIANYERERAEELLEASFAAFQREGDQEQPSPVIEHLEARLEREKADARCELGDVDDYLSMVEARNASPPPDGFRSTLSPGSVIDVKGGSRDGRYVILRKLNSKNGGARYLVLSTSGRVSTLGHKQIPGESGLTGSIELPYPFKPRDRRFVQQTVKRLRKLSPALPAKSIGETPTVAHPVTACPDAASHLAALRRSRRTAGIIEQYRTQRRSSGVGLVEEFRSIGELLGDLDYVQGWSLTSRGTRLRHVYNETGLLVVECIERGVLYGLDPSELAAIVSAFVYEPRSEQQSTADWPTATLADRWEMVEETWEMISSLESRYRLPSTRRPDPGFGRLGYDWAEGVSFDALETGGMAPGDFVRISRQLADLLRQLRDGIRELSEEAEEALSRVDRGIVAAQGAG